MINRYLSTSTVRGYVILFLAAITVFAAFTMILSKAVRSIVCESVGLYPATFSEEEKLIERIQSARAMKVKVGDVFVSSQEGDGAFGQSRQLIIEAIRGKHLEGQHADHSPQAFLLDENEKELVGIVLHFDYIVIDQQAYKTSGYALTRLFAEELARKDHFFSSGHKKADGIYDLGKREGKWTEYYENGTIRLQGCYVNGLREGQWKSWDESGVCKIEFFYKGQLLGTAKK